MTAATGHHFARPGNRFWPVLHLSGFTPRLLMPAEQDELLSYGLGITNVVARATARADELSAEEYRAGGRLLAEKVTRLRPRWLAVVGVTAYRTAFDERKAQVGPQERRFGDTRVWVLPNPSGLNAHWTAATMAEEYGRLREAASWAPHVGKRAGAGRADLTGSPTPAAPTASRRKVPGRGLKG